MHWLATESDQMRQSTIRRFDPRFWTVDFPRPMMAAITTPSHDAIRMSLVFYNKDDLGGLIWESEDRWDHPLLRYRTDRDYSGLTLSFRWTSANIRPLDVVHGPTLTIEGRDAAGAPHTWYVRLWNYAQGTPEDAVVTLDFDALDGGFLLPSEADPVYPRDIDRMFFSLVPPDYDGAASGPIEEPPGTFIERSATLDIAGIALQGGPSMLPVGDAYVRPHRARLSNGYDDTYNLAPERILRNAMQLGYRGRLIHYAGMSHFFSLSWNAGEGRFIVDPVKPPLNSAAEAWHREFLTRAHARRYRVICSLSFEILNDHIPEEWRQRAFDGGPALTGWSPPSSLIAPTHAAALAYLRDVQLALAALQAEAGAPIAAQIGEPWWWHNAADGKPCFYDATTTALYVAETGLALPPMHQSVAETPTPEQSVYLDWLGETLGQATLWLKDEIKAAHPSAEAHLLIYTPQILDASAPMLAQVNLPVAKWSSPAFDILEIEDYDFVIAGDFARHRETLATAFSTLGYAPDATLYLAGFNLLPETAHLWRNIERAAEGALSLGLADVAIWAYPQIARDGFVRFDMKEDDVNEFHEVSFPETIGFGATGGPGFSTDVVTMASGHEQRNVNWAGARARYNVGTGLRSEADLAALVAFFRARRGRAFGFRFKDFADWTSSPTGQATGPLDQEIGIGDGAQTAFQLTKSYGADTLVSIRKIAKPIAGTVRIALAGVEQSSGWSVDPESGRVTFDTAPPAGAAITAGFQFETPVRFASDHLAVTLETFGAGAAPDVPLVEIRV